jgi:hypothetical protein
MLHGAAIALSLMPKNAPTAGFAGCYALMVLFTLANMNDWRLTTIIAKAVESAPKSAARKPSEWRTRVYDDRAKSFFIRK